MHALALIAALVTSSWTMSDVPSTPSTYPIPVVFTGNNASGTGTVRIRPSDEDTQLVLCESSNNASPEVCAAFSFSNFSVNEQYFLMGNNIYYNTSTAAARLNTSMTAPYTLHRSGNANPGTGVFQGAISVAGNNTGLFKCVLDSGGTTATCTVYSGNTLDVQGPILNGGSATCNGILAGNLCINDDIALYSANGLITTQAINATAATGLVLYTSGSVNSGALFFGNASVSDADFASKVVMRGVGYPLSMQRTDAVAAGTTVFEVMDNTSATGATLLTVDGAGNLFLNATATRTKGTITLAAGTGTATVSSGCVPICQNITDQTPWTCAVSGTTLTAGGTGTDVIAYICL